MNPDPLYPRLFRSPVHLMVEVAFRNGENAVCRLHGVQALDVVLHFLTEESGHLNDPVALGRLGVGDNVLALDTLVGFRDGNRLLLKVEVCRGEGQQLPLPNTAPVEHIKGVVGEGLVHHGVGKFQILFLRPEQHFTPFLHPHVPGLGRRIDLEAVVADSMVKEGT